MPVCTGFSTGQAGAEARYGHGRTKHLSTAPVFLAQAQVDKRTKMNPSIKIIPGFNGAFNFFQIENNPHPLQAELAAAAKAIHSKERPAATRQLVNQRYGALKIGQLEAARRIESLIELRMKETGLWCRYANSFIAWSYQPQEWKDLERLKQALLALAAHASAMNAGDGQSETLRSLYVGNCLAARNIYDTRVSLLDIPESASHEETQKAAVKYLLDVYRWGEGNALHGIVADLKAGDFIYVDGIDHPAFVNLEATVHKAEDYLQLAETSVRQMKDMRGQITSWAASSRSPGSGEAAHIATQQRRRRLLYQFSFRSGLAHAELELREQLMLLNDNLSIARLAVEGELQHSPEWSPPSYRRLAMQSNCIAAQLLLKRIQELLRPFSEELSKTFEPPVSDRDGLSMATSFAE